MIRVLAGNPLVTCVSAFIARHHRSANLGGALRVSGLSALAGLFVAGLVAAGTASAQTAAVVGSWTQLSPSTSPTGRFDASMAYDPANGTVVLFGGESTGGALNDTWIWDGSTWRNANPAASPLNRIGAAMAFDAQTGKVVLFGGINGNNFLGDTWAWDGTNWTQVDTGQVNGPSQRENASMAYDASSGNLVMFGGYGGCSSQLDCGNELSDTWIWDGTTWVQEEVTAPPGRDAAAMTYDGGTETVVLFGGDSGGSFDLNDTWTWNSSGWTDASPGTSPSARTNASMAYDGSTGHVVLFGGVTYSGTQLSDTWIWNGSNWISQTVSGPSARPGASMTNATAGGGLLLFGGEFAYNNYASETWTYETTSNFGSINVGSTSPSETVTFLFTSADTGISPSVVTQGAAGLDFTDAGGGTCDTNGTSYSYSIGDTCTVNVKFSPLHPGLRMGAVVFKDGSGNVQATAYVYGTGTGPAVAFPPGIISTVAGTGTEAYNGDSILATSAELYVPNGVAVDSAGNLYIAETLDSRIRKVTAATGIISTVAGNGTTGYSEDGVAATSSELDYPHGVALDGGGNLYIADGGNNRIREVSAATGVISTVAGTGTGGFNEDGVPATSAELTGPYGVAVDGAGNLYIADLGNNRIRMVTAATGVISTVAGNGTGGFNADGVAATSAELYAPTGVAVDGAGNL